MSASRTVTVTVACSISAGTVTTISAICGIFAAEAAHDHCALTSATICGRITGSFVSTCTVIVRAPNRPVRAIIAFVENLTTDVRHLCVVSLSAPRSTDQRLPSAVTTRTHERIDRARYRMNGGRTVAHRQPPRR